MPTEAGQPVAPPPPPAPNRPLSLRLNMAYAVGGTGVQNLCRFGAVVFITKFASPELLGQYNAGLALTTPLIVFAMLNLRAVLIADTQNRVPFGNYLWLRMVGLALAAIILSPIIGWKIWLRPEGAFALILIATFVGKLVDSEAEIYWGLYQKDERMDLVAWSNMLRGVAMLLPFAITLPAAWYLVAAGAVPPGVQAFATGAAIAVSALAWALITLWFDRPRARKARAYDASWTWPQTRALAIRALPLGIVTLLISLTTNIPRLYIESTPHGDRALGFFSALSWIVQAANLVVIQLGFAASNRLATYFRDDVRAFVALVLKLEALALLVCAAVLAVTLLLGPWLLATLYQPEYAEHFPAFLVLVSGQCILFLSSLLGFAVTQMQLFWVQVFISLSMCAAATITSALMIPSNPIAGGAWATLAMAIVQLVCFLACLIAGIRMRPALLARRQAAAAAADIRADSAGP